MNQRKTSRDLVRWLTFIEDFYFKLLLCLKCIALLLLMLYSSNIVEYLLASLPSGKDWIDVLQGLLTPTIAVGVAVITWRQYRLQIHEKRWETFREYTYSFEISENNHLKKKKVEYSWSNFVAEFHRIRAVYPWIASKKIELLVTYLDEVLENKKEYSPEELKDEYNYVYESVATSLARYLRP